VGLPLGDGVSKTYLGSTSLIDAAGDPDEVGRTPDRTPSRNLVEGIAVTRHRGEMRVTFDRLADHQWAHVLIERDDHVVYRMHAGPVTAELPHDLVHYTVEDALGLADGIWGAIAGGVVFRSMTHVSGRRPPHAAERSTALIRQYRDNLQRAELLGGLIETAAHRPEASEPLDLAVRRPGGDLARLAAKAFSDGSPLPSPEKLAGAVAAVRDAELRWRALPIGGQLVLEWPAHRRIATPSSRGSRDRTASRRR
jgi:hypothetical protein